jgi:hypothetical protein
MTVNDHITKARELYKQGKGKQAAYELTDAAVACRDKDQAREIKAFALEAASTASFLRKGQWKEVARIADMRLAS